jgi:Concanavalin A-like lectin/glucanases superfamily/PA14 domain
MNTIIRHSSRYCLLVVLLCATLLAPRASAGSAIRLYYDGISTVSDVTSVRTSISTLTNSTIFPDLPTFEEQLDDFTALPNTPLKVGLQGKDDSGVDFGSYIRGYLEAPATGSYFFDIASAGQSALFLSTDATVENKVLIAYEPESGSPLFGGPRQETRLSAPIALIRGQKYYFEVLHKQGGSRGYIQVGWQRPDGIQEIIPALHLAQYPVDPFLGIGDPNQAPAFNPKGFNAGNLLKTNSLNEGDPLVLQLDVVAAQPTVFSWTSNGIVIPGENLSYYALAHVPATLDGAQIAAIVSNGAGSLTSSVAKIFVKPDTTPPIVLSADTAGNPNLLSITFSKPLNPSAATNLANYQIRILGGATLAAQSATLLADEKTVQLSGPFNFQALGNYIVTVANVRDLAVTPNVLSPNPTDVPFTLSAPSGVTYTFNAGRPSGISFYGTADVATSGSYDNSGYLTITDAKQSKNGAIVLTDRHDIDQFHLHFKVRVGDGGSVLGTDVPGDGFSVNIAGDLPQGTISGPDLGYTPDVPGNRFTVSFNSHAHSALDVPAISVLLNNQVIAHVPVGTNGIPSITSPDGHWAEVDINLRRSGLLSVSFDGVTVIDSLPTQFQGVPSAQIGFAAGTSSGWYETHWFDDIFVNLSEGNIGDVGLSADSVLSGTFPEGSTVRLAAVPTGAGPLFYQWFKNNQPISGETNRILAFPAQVDSGGSFFLTVSNLFSAVTSVAQAVVVQPDLTPASLVSVRGIAGGVNEVVLVFNKPLDPDTATRLSTFGSPLFKVQAVQLSADGRTVTLKTTQQRVGVTYPITITGLKDLSAAGNVLNTQTTFLSSLAYADEILADNPTRYYRFDETTGTVAFTQTSISDQQNTNGIYQNLPILGVAPLVPSAGANEFAAQFVRANTNWVLLPNGGDVNDLRGPWSQKSFEFWFKANSLPTTNAPPANASAATLLYLSTAGIYEEGGSQRGISFYLIRYPTNTDPAHVDFVFHAYNSTTDGPGSPFGLLQLPPCYVSYTVTTNVTYHVVALFDGRPTDRSGQLRLYINGQLVGTSPGVGQIYNHNGDVEVGKGNARNHLSQSGAFGAFDGVIDDLSLYNTVLSEDRLLAHRRAATGESLAVTNPATFVSKVDSRGNPNRLTVVFNQPVSAQTATNLANYALTQEGGGTLAIQSAVLADDLVTVQLNGNFAFQSGATYDLAVQNVADILAPSNVVTPSVTPFTFATSGPAGIALGSDLTDKVAVENGRTQFYVVPTGQPPYRFQWNLNNAPIPGATNSALLIRTPLSAAGSYSVTVANEFSSFTSAGANLTVTPDVTPPSLLNVRALAGSLNQMRLTFSEGLDPATATNLANYSIPSTAGTGLQLLGATISADRMVVTLQTNPQSNGQTNALALTGLHDLAAKPNSLTTTVTFVSGISYRDEVIGDGAVRYWTFDETSGTDFNTLVSQYDTALENLVGTLLGGPTLGVTGLVPNLPDSPAIAFNNASPSNYIAIPNARDFNAILGPWPKRTHLFSFRADQLPRVNGTNIESPAIFSHDIVEFYLYGTQDTNNPTEAQLVFRAHNTSSDGPGSPWGGTTLTTSKHVLTTIKRGQTYQVAGVIDGAFNFTGQLRLYVNGQLAGTVGGIGVLYKHPNNLPSFAQGSFTRHDGFAQNLTFGSANYNVPFGGVIDEFSIINRALSPARIEQLYAFSQTPSAAAYLGAGSPQIAGAHLQNGQLVITWSGPAKLQRADRVDGTFSTLPNATSPYSEPLGPGQAYFRLQP